MLRITLMLGFLGALISGVTAQYPAPATILDLAWNATGEWLAVGYQNGKVEVIDTTTHLVVFSFDNGKTPAATVAWHPTNPKLLAVGIDIEIYLLDISTNQTLVSFLGTPFSTNVGLETQGFSEQLRKVVWSPDGIKLASLSDAGAFRIWNLQNNLPTLLIDQSIYQSGAIDWNADGTQIAISRGLKVVVFDLASGITKELKQNELQANWMGALDWSPDGTKIAVGSTFAEAHVFDASTGSRLQTIVIDTILPIAVRDVSWHRDSRYYAGAASDGSIYIWDSTNGKLVLQIEGDKTPMYAVTWHPIGTQLAYGGEEGVLHIVEIDL